jgi:hypothetical protein
MTKHHTGDDSSADSSRVAACVVTLNRTIGELARQFGPAPVVAALTQVMGCSSCIGRTDRNPDLHELLKGFGGSQ